MKRVLLIFMITAFAACASADNVKSNGMAWTLLYNNGFGDPNNIFTPPIIIFNGHLYAGTVNYVTGGDVWRSSGGVVWIQVSIDGFGDPNNIFTGPTAVFNSLLSSSGPNTISGGKIWRSPSNHS